MNLKQRITASKFIKKNALEYHIAWRDESDIDKHNITGAAMNAFHECLDRFRRKIKLIIMDGSYFLPYEKNNKPIKHKCVPKADSKYLSVSCASILAKTSRDIYIYKMCSWFPELNSMYDIIRNVGYPTPNHIEGIKKHGVTQFHRKSYKPCQNTKYTLICTSII